LVFSKPKRSADFILSKFNGIRAEEVKSSESGMGRQLHILTEKLEGMEFGRQEFLEAAGELGEHNHQPSIQQREMVHHLAKHERLIGEASKFSKKTGKFAEMVKTTDRARAIVAVLTPVTANIPGGIEIGTLIADGESRAVGITNDAKFALEFLQ
jgi:hypothetical protein